MENSINAGAMVAKGGVIEVLAQPRHKGAEHRRAVEVNPLPIDGIMRSLASLEKLRTPIEIRTLSDVEDGNDVLETPLKTSPHQKITKRLGDGRRACRCVFFC